MEYFKATLVLIVAILLLGCNGGEAPPEEPGTEAPPAPAPGVEEEEEAPPVEEEEVPPVDEVEEEPAGDALSGFQSIIAQTPGNYKVSYETTATNGYEMVTHTTNYFKGSNIRTDTQSEMGGMEMLSSMYLLDTGSYLCTETEGEMMCMEMSIPGTTAQEDTAGDIESNPEDYTIVPKSPRTIAGMQATCFGITGADVEGEVEGCYSQGIMLYIHYASQEMEMTMIATDVQIGGATDADFVLPSEPIDLGDIMGQYGDYSGYT